MTSLLATGTNAYDAVIALLNVAQAIALTLIALRGEQTFSRMRSVERKQDQVKRDLDHTDT